VTPADFFLYECRVCNAKRLMLPAGGRLSECECGTFGGADPEAINISSLTKDGDGWNGEPMGTFAEVTGVKS
jgi:hypothetical protein